MLKLLLDKSSRVHIFQYLSTCICYKKKKTNLENNSGFFDFYVLGLAII